jgi:hypothetical protein
MAQNARQEPAVADNTTGGTGGMEKNVNNNPPRFPARFFLLSDHDLSQYRSLERIA